jgi:hypothetical protein
MTKKELLDDYMIVIEPKLDRVEIDLNGFIPFLNSVEDVSDDYNISETNLTEFLSYNIRELSGMIGEKIHIERKETKPDNHLDNTDVTN